MWDVQINRRRFFEVAAAGALAGPTATFHWSAGRGPESECCSASSQGKVEHMGDYLVKLITLDPAHFHAALLQKQMLPGIDQRVAIFAPLGPDVLAHLKLIEQFNTRPDHPTHWELDVHCTPRSLEEMLAARPGNVVVLAGRNRLKIGKINAALEAGLNVLADKPWIIRAEDFTELEAALARADSQGLAAYDIMTERHEITNLMQRALVNDPAVFGAIIPADRDHPGVFMESTHFILKTVAGAPNPRPPFFFDILDQGEGLTDVGTHLVDLAHWTLFPDRAIDYRQDIQVQGGKRWATPLTAAEFRQVTGAATFPAELAPYVHGDQFDYYCNNQVDYQIRGAQVRLTALWKWESPAGVDFHHAIYRGTRASVEIRQTAKENYRPEVFVAANGAANRSGVAAAVRARIRSLRETYPGVAVENAGDELHIAVPDRYRVGHEAHFTQVAQEFLKYLAAPKLMPAWERPNMLAKYYVTTTGVQMSKG
jgi:predicted dehydrogenase